MPWSSHQYHPTQLTYPPTTNKENNTTPLFSWITSWFLFPCQNLKGKKSLTGTWLQARALPTQLSRYWVMLTYQNILKEYSPFSWQEFLSLCLFSSIPLLVTACIVILSLSAVKKKLTYDWKVHFKLSIWCDCYEVQRKITIIVSG